MFKLIGFMLILNSLVFTAYWVLGENPHKYWAISICSVAIAAGIFLILQHRQIEIENPYLGKMAAAAEQAAADANEISKLKERIKNQSATIDLIADKAASTIEQLRSIACTIAEASLTDSMAANFMGAIDFKTRLDSDTRIINSLIEIGVSEENIRNVKKKWSKGIGVIYNRKIRNALEGRANPNQINMEASPELRKASKEFQEMLNFSQWEVPSPDKMESFIEEKGFMNDDVKELINDYRYFLEKGGIRRRNVFEQLE